MYDEGEPGGLVGLAMLVGLIGRSGAGKTTGADALRSLGYQSHRFAGPLKGALSAIGVEPDRLESPERKDQGGACGRASGRQCMRELGDLVRSWDAYALVRRWEATIPAGCVVADDLRTQAEADAVRRMGGIVIGIQRPGVLPTAHATEQIGIAAADIWVRNTGDAVSLRRSVLDAARIGLHALPRTSLHTAN